MPNGIYKHNSGINDNFLESVSNGLKLMNPNTDVRARRQVNLHPLQSIDSQVNSFKPLNYMPREFMASYPM